MKLDLTGVREALETTLDRKFRAIVGGLNKDKPAKPAARNVSGRHAKPPDELDAHNSTQLVIARRFTAAAYRAHDTQGTVQLVLTREEWRALHALVCFIASCEDEPCLLIHDHNSAFKSWVDDFNYEIARKILRCTIIYRGDVHFTVIPLH